MDNKLYPDAYNKWAGNPQGHGPDYDRCCVEIWPKDKWGMTSRYQCKRARGFGPDKAYCKIHDPAKAEARRVASDKRYYEKINKQRYNDNGPVFFDALQKIADGHNDARGLAQEVITEFKKGEYKT